MVEIELLLCRWNQYVERNISGAFMKVFKLSGSQKVSPFYMLLIVRKIPFN